MKRGRWRALALSAVLVLGPVSLATAQVPIRVRGAIVKLSGQTLTVSSRDNSTAQVSLGEPYTVAGVVKAALSDVKPGVFVGVAALPRPDGSFRAQGILVYPESARGTAEGHHPWDLSPGSTMTNATVDAIVEGVEGPLLTLKHRGGSVKVAVPPGVPIATLTPGDRALLRPGAYVFIPAQQHADGRVTAGRVLVGRDGLIPPM